jgi:hypothetical protein
MKTNRRAKLTKIVAIAIAIFIFALLFPPKREKQSLNVPSKATCTDSTLLYIDKADSVLNTLLEKLQAIKTE